MTSSSRTYVPGVCNIGGEEVSVRRRFGWGGLGATVLLWAAFFIFHVPAAWRILLFLPAALSATGFLQAALHFCAAFGMRGVFNFKPQVGKTETVERADFRRKDRAKASQILGSSLLIGIAIALAGYFSG